MNSAERIDSSGFWNFRKKPPISHRDSALLLAEELSSDVAEDGLRHYSETRTPEGLLQSSWRMLEYAMSHATPLDRDMRKMYISYYVPQLLADVLAVSSESNPLHRPGLRYTSSPQHNHYHQALLLGAHVPLFNRRAHGEAITHEDCRNLHDSMAIIIHEDLKLGISAQDTRLSENVTTMLSSRTGQPDYLLHLASPREESSHTAVHNHDRYFIYEGTKIPVQIKIGVTALRYDEEVQVLDIEGMLRFAAVKSNLEAHKTQMTVAPYVHTAARLLVEEHDNELLYPEERAFLNVASQAIVAIRKKAQYTGMAA